MTRDEYEHNIFGSMLRSDAATSNDESADTVENDEQSVPLAETTSMLSDECICRHRRTGLMSCDSSRHRSRHCYCYHCSKDTPDPWWTNRQASQPHEEAAASARNVN